MTLPLLALSAGIQGVLGGIERKAQAKRVGNAAIFNRDEILASVESVASAGSETEIRSRHQGQKLLASMQARLAAAGIDTTEGFGLMASLALQDELEVEFGDIRDQTTEQIRAGTAQAGEFQRQAKDAKKAEKKSFFGGLFG